MSDRRRLKLGSAMALKRRLAKAAPQPHVCARCERGYTSWGHHCRWNPSCAAAGEDECGECLPDELQVDAQARERQAALADSIAELSYSKNLKAAEVQAAVALARIAIHHHNERAADGLRELLKDGVTSEQVAAALNALEQQDSVFKGLETEAQQTSVLRRKYPYLKPRTVTYGGAKEKADSFAVDDLLIRHLTQVAPPAAA
jgi:hypothetical protein